MIFVLVFAACAVTISWSVTGLVKIYRKGFDE